MFVEELLPAARKRLVLINDDVPLLDAAKLLLERHVDLVVVRGSDGSLSGVISKTDVVRQMSQCRGCGCTTASSAVMSRDVTMCHPGDPLRDVWATMKVRGLKNIPIVDDASQPLGVLTARDALESLRKEVEYEEVLLRDYVMCVGYH